MPVPDKRVTVDDVVASVQDGMTVGIGGWGSRRKPMAIVRALLRSPVRDLTVVSYGGPDVGLLCRAGKVRRVVYAFVSLDTIPLEPHFRNARQSGAVDTTELDEGMFLLGLQAAAWRVPFLPTRVGLGSDVMRLNPSLETVTSPYADGEELVAMPALNLDVALIHAQRSDAKGNLLVTSPDPFFDELFARAAPKCFAQVERIVPTAELDMETNARFAIVERARITGVVEAAFGAHPTSAAPDYQLDLKHLKTYVDSASSPEAWDEYRKTFIDVSDADYLAAVGGADAVAALPRPVY